MKKILLIPFIVFCAFTLKAQESYKFEPVVDLDISAVKAQGWTGTCWSFSTVSFLESELLRMGKPEYDLSEMYIVKKAYELKAKNYIKTHGKSNFNEGGQAHDVLNEIVDHGLVPESALNGICYKSDKHNHVELISVLSHFLDGVLNAKRPTNVWLDAFNAILDTYLGEAPETFEYNGKEYTPQTFAKELGINPDDYVEITSYTDLPYYKQSVLMLPDNWSFDKYYNVPLEEFMQIMNNSLKKGYTFVWDGDMSDKGFSRQKGIAVVEDESDKEQKYLESPAKEKHINAEYRQSQFDGFKITDDHLMHIVGLAKDQNGTMYYTTKNSWGTNYTYDGLWYMSEQFMRLHTVAIMVHKNAIPKQIRSKLKL